MFITSKATATHHLIKASRNAFFQHSKAMVGCCGARRIHITQKSKNAAALPQSIPQSDRVASVTTTERTARPLHPLVSKKPYYQQQQQEMDDSFVGMSGGEIFHEMMLRHNVKHIFGYPGGAILPVFDAIYESKYFDFILPRHEQGAGHMAEGYAKATGKPGVVLVTSGPGATNVVTAMADALADGIPLVVFSGQVITGAIGTDAFQEADVVGITRSCSKWNVMVKDIAELPRRINEAFTIATSGRPGPVLVDLPKDITAGILRKPIPTHAMIPSRPSTPIIPNTAVGAFVEQARSKPHPVITRAIELINKAKRPVIYAGHGVLGHPDGPELMRELSHRANIPVTTTLHGLGTYDELDPKALHMLGMHGSCYANLAMQNADLILALGARFDDRVTGDIAHFAPEAFKAAKENRGGILHFEIMPKNINKVVQATEAIEGDVTENLKKILPHIKPQRREAWLDQIQAWKEAYPFYYDKTVSDDETLKPQQLIEELDKQTRDKKEKVTITTGVGQHQMWTAQMYRWTQPRSLITSGGLGTMGYGLPAAIGAKVAKPAKDEIVIDIDGDASFSMTAMELATAAEFNIGVKVLLLNNSFQGMVKQWQDLFYKNRYSGTIMTNPDFVKLAEAMGVKAIRVTKASEVESKMKEFLEYNEGPVLMDAVVCKKEVLFPMVPGGKPLHEFLLHPHVAARNQQKKD
ncbi:thiamine diphosphate-binding protein [Mycotypha africana]|uniref:thiamine diphosphate-binding protein n=1 Tax=Mycotypha africana TaxID=64632 RepID=UPI00230191F5|nr:thiamine diphosphate-binding protein [Mycotypha africana]KAI8966954.1 thiamine diphosphate-binding protein [Mycotypha africana]